MFLLRWTGALKVFGKAAGVQLAGNSRLREAHTQKSNWPKRPEWSLGQCVTNDRRRGVGKAAIDQNAREHELATGVCALHDFGVK
jgi:hypothetical protein